MIANADGIYIYLSYFKGKNFGPYLKENTAHLDYPSNSFAISDTRGR
jgi:hypothetical protein